MQSMCKVNGVSVTTGLQMCICTLWMHQWKRPLRGSLCFGFAARTAAPSLLSGTALDFLHDLGLFIWACHLLFSARGWKGSWTKAIKPVLDQRKQKGGKHSCFQGSLFAVISQSVDFSLVSSLITQADSVFFCFVLFLWLVCLFVFKSGIHR